MYVDTPTRSFNGHTSLWCGQAVEQGGAAELRSFAFFMIKILWPQPADLGRYAAISGPIHTPCTAQNRRQNSLFRPPADQPDVRTAIELLVHGHMPHQAAHAAFLLVFWLFQGIPQLPIVIQGVAKTH